MSGGLVGLVVRFLRRGFAEAKRGFDVVAACILLLPFAPVIGLLALLVKLTSRGPAFFTQVRVGKDGRLFNMIKLRTMRQNAEHLTGPVWAGQHDPRITPLGRLLRLSHMDESPQLWNVLQGDMSLVGPRPERPFFVNQFRRKIPHYEKRLSVRPGITGLAQVKYKYDETIEDVEKKLAYDLTYVHQMGWKLEFKILFWTLGCLTGKGAR
jgi:lipopolysaccharide/colanic/teichoic acid biosynthesis glycosyltransferase